MTVAALSGPAAAAAAAATACSTVNFLWGAAKGRAAAAAAAAAGAAKETPQQQQRKLSLVVFILGGLSPIEAKAIDRGAPDGGPPVEGLYISSSCLATPSRLAAQLFGDLFEELEAS